MKTFFFFSLYSLFFILCSWNSSTAQTTLLEQDVNADTLSPKSGPNMKNYTHSYFRYGFVLGKSDSAGAEVLPGYSNEFTVGVRYKRKISNFYALGFDVAYSNANYRMKQDSSKIFPVAGIHKKEKLTYNNLGLEIYNRFNFGKRGNILGNFLDLGGYGEWGFGIKHFFKDELDTARAGAKVWEVTNKQLLYTNDVNYGAVARMGINRYVVYAKYRASNLFKESYHTETGLKYPELPRVIVGFEIGLMK